MLSRCLRAGALLLALYLPSVAQAQVHPLFMGGVTAPVSRLGDITDLGYNLSAGLNIGVPTLPVGVRLEGGYNSLGTKGGNTTVNIITGTVNAIFNLGPQGDAPYLIGGLGIYNRGGNAFFSSTNAIGLNGGGGLRFPLSGINTFFEARYHIMLGSSGDATNFQFIPITFGLSF